MAPPDFWWVSPLVVSIGILVSISLAAQTVETNRRIARQKATMDLIEGSESKDYYQRLYHSYKQFRSDAEYRRNVLDPRSDDTRKLKQYCFDFLNHYELVAIGIRRGILEEEFYRMWMEYSLLRDWREGQELITLARNPQAPGDAGDVQAYCNLEALAVKWGADPHWASPRPWYRRDNAEWT